MAAVLLNVPLMTRLLNDFAPVALLSVSEPVTVVVPATLKLNAAISNVPLATVQFPDKVIPIPVVIVPAVLIVRLLKFV